MYRDHWKKIHKSICSITHIKNGEKISSGTGFKIDNYLLTNNHVIQVPPATHVILSFVEEDGYSIAASKEFIAEDFNGLLLNGSEEDSWDYAILNLKFDEFNSIPSLTLHQNEEFEIGQSIIFYGYQFGQPNLSIHSGILASRFEKVGVKYLQLDASVNQGNSGGPLIDANTLQVIGIITRKATGLSKQFDDLLDSFKENIKIIDATLKGGSGIFISGVNPMEVLKVSQSQMEKISREIKRSANVGVGFAYQLNEILEGLSSLD